MPLSKEDRFWLLVDKRSEEECWPYKGSLNSNGYGRHREAYEYVKGPIPPGLVVMHSCDNRSCCNPFHLDVGTQQENVRQAHDKGRVDYRNISLSCRAKLQGTGVQHDKRSNNNAVMFKVLGRPLYIGMYKDAELAHLIAKAAIDEVKKLMRTNEHITYDQIKEHFCA